MNMSVLRSILKNLFIYLESLVQRTPTEASDSVSPSLSSIYLIIEWEAFYLLFDHVLYVVRKEVFSSSTSAIKFQTLLITPTMTEQFLRTLKFLLQFTPGLSEHIHGHVLNLLSCMFFITLHDQTLAIQIIQRLLTTFQSYQQQAVGKKVVASIYLNNNSSVFFLVGTDKNQCETMQIQASNAFLYLCKNYTDKIIEFYSELFPFLCQLYKNEFQLTKTFLSITIDELTAPTLKILDSLQILFFHKLIHTTKTIENGQLEEFYELIKPIYEILNISLKADTLPLFIEYLDLYSKKLEPINIIRYRRRSLMLALHCLCLLLRYSKQQQQQIDVNIRLKISVGLRPILFDFILKVTQFCNQLYDRQANPFYDILKENLTYSDTERQLYLGTYESNNMAKATISST